MSALRSVPLDGDWRYRPSQPGDAPLLSAASQLDAFAWGGLKSLSDWPAKEAGGQGSFDLLKRFDLEPITDVCVRYVLHISAPPMNMRVFINGWSVAEVLNGETLEVDVTDYVTLEDNYVLLRVTQASRMGNIRLQPIPCADAE